MKSYDQLMLESLYKSMYNTSGNHYCKKFDNDELCKLVEQDLKTIDELIEEGIFGDVLNKAKQGASALVGKAKQTVSNIKQGISQTIVKKVMETIMSKLGDQEKAKFFSMIAGGEIDKNSIQQLKQNVDNQQVQESFVDRDLFEDDKEFFVKTFFTKEIIQEAIETFNIVDQYNEFLIEADIATGAEQTTKQNRPLRTAMQYSNKEAERLAVNMITKLKELYGNNPRYLKQAVPKVLSAVNKKVDSIFQQNLGVSSSSNSGSSTPSSNAAAGATDSQTPPNLPSEQTNTTQSQPDNQPNQQTKPGFIQRVLKFVSNPKVYVTAGIAVAIAGFIAAAMGGAPVAAILAIYAQKMAIGAGAKLITGAVARKIKGQKVIDAKSLASDAGKGMLMGAFAAGLGSIAAVVGKSLFGSAEVAAHPSQAPTESQPSTVPQEANVPPVGPSTPKLDANEVFKIATKSQFTGAEIDKPRMDVLKTLIDANSENNMGLSKGQIAKVFGDWSARAGAGAGITDPQKIINAINQTTNQKDLVNLMLKAAGKQ